jgi:hypothetical protein
MGLTLETGIISIMKEGLKNSFKDKSILMLGKQDIWLTIDEFVAVARKLRYKLSEVDDVKIIHNGHIDCYSFFELLGFNEVNALDVSDYENANIVFNLNNNDIPEELRNRFDYIIDGGTFEHVFNVPNAFKNVINMLKVGGKIFHYVPSNNWMNHGFYSFSPMLFIDYYNTNKFFIEDVSLIYPNYRDDQKYLYNELGTKIDCRLIDFGWIGEYNSNSKLAQSNTTIECIVRKNEDSTCDLVPIQSNFFLTQEFEEQKIAELNDKIKNYPSKSVVLYGAGDMARKIVKHLEESNDESIEKILGVMDRNTDLIGKKICGFEVLDIEKAKEDSIKAIIVATKGHEEEAYYRIKYLKDYDVDIIKILNPCN